MTANRTTPGEGESLPENRLPTDPSADVWERLELMRHHASAGHGAETAGELMGTLDELQDTLLSLRGELEDERREFAGTGSAHAHGQNLGGDFGNGETTVHMYPDMEAVTFTVAFDNGEGATAETLVTLSPEDARAFASRLMRCALNAGE